MESTIASMLNTQIQKEFESAYIYLGFAAFFDMKELSGFSKWYKKQAKEEEGHAMKIYDYLCRVNHPVELLPIGAPRNKPETVLQVLNQSLEHEEYVTNLISALYFQAEKEKDLFAKNFLNWFISEQIEEEQKARLLIGKYKTFGSTPEGLHSLDLELGRRIE
ncbi:ferritin [Treponema sp.]|uniref:ferritin n=1 Tax=Treponema sp. TaxID=166 RepID=UPI003EFECBE2